MTKDEIAIVLEKHVKWLRGEPSGERANLDGANLTRADLYEANLTRADLYEANLAKPDGSDPAHLPKFSIVPSDGQFTAWKTVYRKDGSRAVLRLRVPPKSKRVSSLVGRKCRVEYARVLSAETLDGAPLDETFRSYRGPTEGEHVDYSVGDVIRCHEWNDDIRIECAPGIHCFITKQEAIEYEFS